MNTALQEAWKYQGLTYPNPAVGCCIISNTNEILAVEAHHKAGEAHAEVNSLKSAYYKLTSDDKILKLKKSVDIHSFLLKNHNNIFQECSVYTTLEPCSKIEKTPSCANLLTSLNIKKVYIGSSDSYQDNFNAEFGILEKECNELLYPFQCWKKKNFVFFKLAQRLDGSTDGKVTNEETKVLTHAMRDVCDLLVIGGNTIRIDRPILDAREVNGKAPDILIYSRKKEFDITIPLFNVKNRKVIISDNLDELKNYKNIMIEGTSNMYNLTKELLDYTLLYIAPSIGGKDKFQSIEDKFSILNIRQEYRDIIMWMKRG
jgi:diaminohydroxyphosphoribosylaminopyrimidine deaminase/5-amino-6-(5-phosphoribosylamino)uracil reductase